MDIVNFFMFIIIIIYFFVLLMPWRNLKGLDPYDRCSSNQVGIMRQEASV